MKKIMGIGVLLFLISDASADATWIRFKLAEPKIELGTLLEEKTFDQKIDHFSTSGGQLKTFKQRYFIDSSLVRGNKAVAPVIYILCGESTCEGASGNPLVNQVAKKYGAHRVALEHRYYGYSQPFKSLTTPHLQYLSMNQALEDLAYFQRYAQESLGLQGKWIAVGGSYAGELAAFYRLKHPELVAGALASSAPVFAKDNFEEYDRHTAKVAGAECLKVIQAVVNEVESRLLSPQTSLEIKKLFKSQIIRDDTDFLYVIADMAAVAIQYGYQQQFCSKIIDGHRQGQAVEAYAKAGTMLFANFGITPLQDSFQGAESINPEDYVGWFGLRSWMYQSCTEFGFYQIAYSIPSQSARSSKLTMDYHHRVCQRLFGLTKKVDVNKTNSQFYHRLFDSGVKNIYFTNGANDPWSNLSITGQNPQESKNPGLKFFVIPGASHCEDLGSNVSSALQSARAKFQLLVKSWISE